MVINSTKHSFIEYTPSMNDDNNTLGVNPTRTGGVKQARGTTSDAITFFWVIVHTPNFSTFPKF